MTKKEKRKKVKENNLTNQTVKLDDGQTVRWSNSPVVNLPAGQIGAVKLALHIFSVI